ncbi:hypothetical protein OH76DRAFT_1470177 [Lentinus brumalis]|uniref:WKF domain-containing protein n=1 Tax=Lentinus brumalis TaxID=2498619 RepID=A0A371DL14_9APHY|nr:hypothetical protein OH76DRAFT_1470177 [Polyporus brumalis]
MSADSAEKTSRKHKKAKDVASTVDAPERDVDKPRKSKKAKAAGEASAPVDATNEPAQDVPLPKEKKHKKRKHADGAEDVESPVNVTVEEPKKKKKRRDKGKAVDGGGDVDEITADGLQEQEEKKRKKKARTTDVEGEDEEAVLEGKKARHKKSQAEEPASSEASPVKAKKEKKKKRKTNDADDEHAAKPDIADSDKKSKKKRKRHSISGFPDPSEDESLSEQAQKALHYAFTQFEDPGSWKFNKARQNWLIRNVWSEEAIPEIYVPLVTKYLQGVQGGGRESLIKLCREAIEPPKPPAEPATAVPDAQAEATPDGQTDTPAKRTVKFADEPEEGSKTEPTTETKRQRAVALLAVLTTST